MQCPKCKKENSLGTTECKFCGVVFESYKKQQQKAKERSLIRQAEVVQKRNQPNAKLFYLIIGLIAIAGAYYVVKFTPVFGMSEKQIAETVKTSMQKTLDSDSGFQEYGMVVDSVKVFKKSGNQYKGLAIVEYKGSSHNVSVDILVDGGNVMWEAPPGSFMFIAQEEMRRLFQ